MSQISDPFILGKQTFSSRLIIGTGKYQSLDLMKKCHSLTETQMVTVALRRINLSSFHAKTNILTYIDLDKITLIANTASAYSAKEALRLARMAKELDMKFLKIEVMGNTKNLLPDAIETLEAVKKIKSEFTSEDLFLMIYTNDDPILASKLVEAKADCIMPGGSPIGSGRGIQNKQNMNMILEHIQSEVPVILDAGVGSASDAAIAMEMGFDAVLLNSAIALAEDPEKMAEAMKQAVQAGRLSYLAGRIPKKLYGSASSPILDF